MARTVQAGYLARRIEALRAQGMTRRQIAETTGISERTQRKLISGETSGRRWFQRIRQTGAGRQFGVTTGTVEIPPSAEPGRFHLVIHRTDGSYARVSIILPEFARAKRITVLDKQRILNDPRIRDIVVRELERSYKGFDPSEIVVVDIVPVKRPRRGINIPVFTLASR